MISVIIPAYNESENIPIIIKSLRSVLEACFLEGPYEIIVVDDHSSDNTFDLVANLSDLHVRCIRLSRRSGSHIALRAGLAHSTGQAVLCLAADGQDDPQAVGLMIKQWRAGYQVIWACRGNRHQEPFAYRLVTGFFYTFLVAVCKASSQEKAYVSNADFFLLDRVVVDAINACRENQTSVFGLIVWLGFKQTSVNYTRKVRRLGVSKWNFERRMALAKDWLLAFSGFPIRVVGLTGMLTVLFSILYFMVSIFYYGKPSSVVGVVFLIGGIQLTAMGVVGEYVWHTLKESRQRPLYFIERESRMR